MFHRCLSILLVASLVASAGTTWATSVFVDMSATASYEQAWPTGVSQTGGVMMNGYDSSQSNYYAAWAYPAGTAGTMTNVNSSFTASGGTMHRAVSTSMSDNGNVTLNETSVAHDGWIVTGNTGNVASASYATFQYGGTANTRTNAINNNGDVGGSYTGGKYSGGIGANAFIYSGGTGYFLDVNTAQRGSGGGDIVTAVNTNGQAVGDNMAGAVGNFAYATLWTKTGSTWASYTASDLLTVAPALLTLYPGLTGVSALAINNSGVVVLGVNNQGLVGGSPNVDQAYYLYNESTQQYTSLGSLMMWDPIAATLTYNGGHEQSINDSGAVVGYTGTQGSTWHAAIWQSGTITDLNTLYAGILPSGFTLNNATAIDNNGDIVGYGTDSASDTYQAFEILNATPEPGTLTLLAAGFVGLLAYAWRKRR